MSDAVALHHCAACGKLFEKRACELKVSLRLGRPIFCGHVCANSRQSKSPVTSKCPRCNSSFTTPSGKAQRKFCSDFCRHSSVSKLSASERYEEYILKWQRGEVSGGRGEGVVSMHIRRYLFKKYDSKCCECGWSRVNPATGKVPLDVEHIDGDSSNHKEENLKLLCPCCHAITPTYKSLNRGHGRRIRRSKLESKRSGTTCRLENG